MSTDILKINDPGLSIVGTADFLREANCIPDNKFVIVRHPESDMTNVSMPITQGMKIERLILPNATDNQRLTADKTVRYSTIYDKLEVFMT